MGKPLYRATFTFVMLYLFVLLISIVFTTVMWSKILSKPAEGGDSSKLARFCIFVACLFNLQFLLFGLAPKLHRFFEMRDMYNGVKVGILRNVP